MRRRDEKVYFYLRGGGEGGGGGANRSCYPQSLIGYHVVTPDCLVGKRGFPSRCSLWNVVNNSNSSRQRGVLTHWLDSNYKESCLFEKLAETAQWKSKDLQIEAMLSASYYVAACMYIHV